MFRFLRTYGWGILPRYVMAQVARAFTLALLTLTAIFVLFVVVAKVAEAGLGPWDIVVLVPFAVPSTIPYTAPVALLFAVTVVYGRIASDSEVLAIKAAGLGALTVLTPSFVFGLLLCFGLLQVSNEYIPRSNHEAKLAFFRNVEEMLYRILEKEREFNNRAWPFKINVGDVDGKTLIDARFAHRARGDDSQAFDLEVFAERATIAFDQERDIVEVKLTNAIVHGDARKPDFLLIDNELLEIPLPNTPGQQLSPSVQELTTRQIIKEQAQCLVDSKEDRNRNAAFVGLAIASGRPNMIHWPTVHQAHHDINYRAYRFRKLETEKQMRVAIAFSPLFFALLGAPVGIWRAKGDFLSAFMICFLPIITIYYPVTLMGINLSKEGLLVPVAALWMGNLILAVLSGLVLRPVLRH